MFQHLLEYGLGYFVAEKVSRIVPSTPRIDFEGANESDFV